MTPSDMRWAALEGAARLHETTCTVLGVGATGSRIVELLTQVGVPHIRVVDPDTVEPENIGVQSYRWTQVGFDKVEACRQLWGDGRSRVETFKGRAPETMPLSDCMFLCVDTVVARQAIVDALYESKEKPAIVMTGMSLESWNIWAQTKGHSLARLQAYVHSFPAEEGPSCGAQMCPWAAAQAASTAVCIWSQMMRLGTIDPNPMMVTYWGGRFSMGAAGVEGPGG